MTIIDADTGKLCDHCCELGEGPSYNLASNTAWWLDILGKTLYEHRFENGTTLAHKLPRMASVAALIDERRQLLAMEDGLYLRNIANGELALLNALEADNPKTRSNDGRVHPSGNLWISTMDKNCAKGAGAIYWYGNGELRKLFPQITIPNSIAFTADGATGYFADTAENIIWRVALDPATGLPIAAPSEFLTGNDLPLGGFFDGSVMDGNGVLWNAAWGGGSVSGFAADKSLVQTFEIPAAQTTCPAFVGSRLQKMIVTTAWQGLGQGARDADPGAGFTYLLDADFKGIADTNFKLKEL